jgi:hypothetical protein
MHPLDEGPGDIYSSNCESESILRQDKIGLTVSQYSQTFPILWTCNPRYASALMRMRSINDANSSQIAVWKTAADRLSRDLDFRFAEAAKLTAQIAHS